jgi:RNA polymerase sigma-70 factor (ECF subfamily)
MMNAAAMVDFPDPAEAEDNGTGKVVPMTPEAASSTDGDITPEPGNRAEFSRLVQRHHRDLLVFARALTRNPQASSEIVQDAFVTAWEKLATFDVTRDFGAWMRGIVRNKWREWLRRNSRSVNIDDEHLSLLDGSVAEWQSVSARQHNPLFTNLELCLDRLPNSLREAVDAYYYLHNHGDEAAAALGASPAALRKRLQRARQLLRDCLERKLGEQSAT